MIGNDRELPRYSKGAVGIKGAGFLVGLKCGPDHEKIQSQNRSCRSAFHVKAVLNLSISGLDGGHQLTEKNYKLKKNVIGSVCSFRPILMYS